MKHLGFSCILGLLSPGFVLLSDAFAPKTASPVAGSGLYIDNAPLPTEAPVEKLEKRAVVNISPNICGWFSGSTIGGEPVLWSYYNTATTCFWNSDYKIVGDDYPIKTTCVEDGSQNVGSNVLQCQDYRAYVCASSSGLRYQMEPTYDGFTTPIAFPTFTGSDGISVGTQYPGDSPTPTSSTSSESTSSSTSSDFSSSTDSSSSSPTSSSSAASDKLKSKSVPVGPIVGGVIGGLAVVGIIACAIIFMVIRSRKRNNANVPPQPNAENQPPTSDMQKTDAFQPGAEPFQPGAGQFGYPPQFQSHGVPPPGANVELYAPERSELDPQTRFVLPNQHPYFKEHSNVHEAP
ncbi:hypothetical protein FE257_005428 [Aspergillus nanangensis]|uniref:Uncharacterized protein n=1 Tax=Aspergillus nanangensis TaxID=2582783 RepID=A0AAD4CSE2_ASPNN|nr:hypothetical protein FE257_005428 [Aspergillus nanangensis]